MVTIDMSNEKGVVATLRSLADAIERGDVPIITAQVERSVKFHGFPRHEISVEFEVIKDGEQW